MWIKYIQWKHYLSKERQLNEKQRQSQLNVKIHHDVIIRLHGRFISTDLPEDAKLPILLPRQELFSQLLIQDLSDLSLWGITNARIIKPEVLDTTRANCSKDDTQNMSDLSTSLRRAV